MKRSAKPLPLGCSGIMQVAKNREIMRKMIIAALYLGQQEQAFRGHDESDTSRNKGNFVETFAEFDTSLADDLKTSTVFKGTSKTIQNDIIESEAAVIENEIAEIKSTPFIAVQADDTTDVSCKCQLSIILHYLSENGTTTERFLGFYDVSVDRGSYRSDNGSHSKIKLICQTYDGASCMSGQHRGVRAQVKAQCSHAVFIYCYAHRLNLVLAQGTKNIQDAKTFFASLDCFHNFFSRSAKRTTLLTEADNSVRVPGASATR